MNDDLTSPVYPEIDRAASWYGFELEDLAALVLLFWLTDSIVSLARVHIGRADLSLPLSFLVTGFLFMVWRASKVNLPRHFFEDSLGLAAEPEIWILTPDTAMRPAYVIEPDGRHTILAPDPSQRVFRTWTPDPLPGR